MNLELNETEIKGCYELFPKKVKDERGIFVKTFHQTTFEQLGFQSLWVEEYFSLSNFGVLRGMHFQTPPFDHSKLVYCLDGEVLDVIIDLREKSPTFLKTIEIKLNAEKANMMYIPSGLAHGFYTLSNQATLVYKVTSEYNSQYDTGVRWNSLGVKWPNSSPIVSERDSKFVSLQDFKTPFNF